jgi:Zn-dependent metalloprotease
MKTAAVALGLILTLPAAASAAGFPAGAKVVRKPSGAVRFVGSAPGKAMAASSPKAFLEAHAADFGLGRGSVVRAVRSSASAVRFQQSVDGVDVMGGEFVVGVDARGGVRSVLGEAAQAPADMTPALSAADAERVALARVRREEGVSGLAAAPAALRIFDDQLLGGPSAAPAALAWAVEIGDGLTVRRLVVVDAGTGAVRASIERAPEAKTRSVCDAANTAAEVPCASPVLQEGQTYAGLVPDVQPAYDFAGETYDFFFERFGRDSVDGKGLPLKSTVRYCEPAKSCPFRNAFWNGEQMVYGAGFAAADDVVAHELTHGFTEFTSGLYYYFESGAINESLSDVFGELIDQVTASPDDGPADKWKIAETIGTFRDMADPTAFGDPDAVLSPSWQLDPNLIDNGGVHSNSGVNNKAAFLMTEGGSFGGQTIAGLGVDKVARLYFDVETGFLTSGSDYEDLGLALGQACDNRVGAGGFSAADCEQVRKAVLATQMLSDRPEAADLPECPAGQVAVYAYSAGQ